MYPVAKHARHIMCYAKYKMRTSTVTSIGESQNKQTIKVVNLF